MTTQLRPADPVQAANSAANVAEYFAWLVVIDPEDPARVQRLGKLLAARGYMTGDRTEDLQAILRDLLPTPPKPDEPQNRYAAVRDSRGEEWLRDKNGKWCQSGHPVYGTRVRHYADIDAVEVLSEGVTS